MININLFIIGNGFDKGHNLKTGYLDFKEYIKNNNPNFYEKFYTLHQYSFKRTYRNSITEELIIENPDLKDEYDLLWSSLEEHMSIINEDSILNVHYDMGLEFYDLYDNAVYDTISEVLKDLIQDVPELLSENLKAWINNIDLSSVKKITKYINSDSNDLFLNFNYTNVLEEIYEIDSSQICYIHGRIGNELIIGHNNNNSIEYLKKSRDIELDYEIEKLNNQNFEIEEEYHEKYYEIINERNDNYEKKLNDLKCNLLIDYYEKTLKVPEKYINLNPKFFTKILDIANIYVIGHSFGKVDLPYFKEIFKLNHAAKWIVFYFNKKEIQKFKKILLSIGISENNITLNSYKEFYK